MVKLINNEVFCLQTNEHAYIDMGKIINTVCLYFLLLFIQSLGIF